MSKYKLIAYDMDGTLLNSDKEIAEDSIEAIHRAVTAGKYVTLSTGRPVPEIAPYDNALSEVPFYICSSGATILDRRNGKTVFSKALEKDIIREIFAISKDYDLMLHHLSDKSYLEQFHFDHIEDYHMERYRTLYESYAVKVESLQQFFEANQYPVYKFNLYLKHSEERESICKRLSELPITVSMAETSAVECSPLGISRGSALRRLCQYLGIDLEQTIAVGDSDNDLDILRSAGLGAAMGNCNDRVRDVADVVLRDCDHGGCAQAVDEYLLK